MLAREISSAFGFAFVVGLGFLSAYLGHYFNVEIYSEESEAFHPDSFIGTRAFEDLKTLNDFGPKAVGSDANEKHTLGFLLQRVQEIKDTYANTSEISIDLQRVSGEHYGSAHFVDVQNLIVKLHGNSDKALMINCHFDSEVGSYGAGDDLVNCCIMLEVLRVMAKSGKRNDFSVVFLFNGNEEGANLEGLQASYGFITQHPLKEDINAYVNLEAQGYGGREMLFRSGPKHDWLVKKYRESVPHPFGQVFAEEMFETGVMTSGTDFESFRDDGKKPGLDLAFCTNGWVYHTEFDHVRYWTADPIQHTGNNVLALVKHLANSEELENPPEGGQTVFYDMWGLFLVSYSKTTGAVINIIVSIAAVVFPFLVQIKLKMKNFWKILRETLISFVTFTVSLVVSMAASYALGLIMNAVGNTMFWFNTTFLAIGVYTTFTVLVQIAIFHGFMAIADRLNRKALKVERKFDERKRIQAHLNGVNLFWALFTIIVTSAGLRLGYLTMVMLLVSLITNIIMYGLLVVLPKSRIHSWVFVHCFGHTFSFLWISYVLFILWKTFIPITEKYYVANPEMMVGLLSSLIGVMSLSYFIPLANLVKHRALLYSCLVTLFAISLILAFTPVGFPYSGSLQSPRVQRHYIYHTSRTFYDSDGAVKHRDTGFYMVENEKNTKRTLDTFLNPDDLKLINDDPLCETEAFCGYPSYNKSRGFWLPTEFPPNVSPSQLNLKSRTENGNSVEFNFEIIGSLLMRIYLAPEPGVEITETSVGFNSREWIPGKLAYYLKITYGLTQLKPFPITIKVNKSSGVTDLFKITVVTVDSHFDRKPMAKAFTEFVEKFPDYTFVQKHQTDISSYTFK